MYKHNKKRAKVIHPNRVETKVDTKKTKVDTKKD